MLVECKNLLNSEKYKSWKFGTKACIKLLQNADRKDLNGKIVIANLVENIFSRKFHITRILVEKLLK